MPGLDSTKNKHLTSDERQEIQDCLGHGMTFKSIAKRIGKDPTTISKEVKKHLSIKPTPVKKSMADGTPIDDKPCPSLLKAPFVCNPCKRRKLQCSYQKRFYYANVAQGDYKSLLTEAREGIPLNKERFYENDATISKGFRKGQHLYHIMQTNDLGVSKSTVYRHLHRGYLTVSKTEFPRVVKFKARRQRREDYIPKAVKAGRTYEDFLLFKDENNISSWVEMATVIGRIGGKAIMTFDFTFCNFMFGLLLDNKAAAEVTCKIRALKAELSENDVRFGDVFPLVLTDNGGEFANVSAITANADGEIETDLFFCDPYRSSQKPKVEKNHTLFRDIVPKGESSDSFSQEDVDLIFSHVNSVTRKIFNGRTPYGMFSYTFGDNVARLLGIVPIQAGDVIQSPNLLKHILAKKQ